MKKALHFVLAFASAYTLNAQWVQTNGLNTGGPVSNLVTIGNRLFAGASCSQSTGYLHCSTDAGATWTNIQNNHAVFSNVDELVVLGDILFTCTYDYPGGHGNGVYRTDDFGQSWTAMNYGLPNNSYAGDILVDGTRLFCGTSTMLYKSIDSGATWTPSGAGLVDPVQCLAKCGGYYFAGTGDGIYRSSTGGSWSQLSASPIGQGIVNLEASGNTLVATTFGSNIYRSTDYGVTWTLISGGNGLPASGNYVYDLLVSGDHFFVTIQYWGVYASWDNGANWTCLNTPGFTCVCNSLAIDANYLYVAGNGGNDLWRLPLNQAVGIRENNNVVTSVFPNPFRDVITVRVDRPVENAIIELRDVNGKVVREESFSGIEYRLDAATLARGVYLLSIREEDGEEIIQKIIAE